MSFTYTAGSTSTRDRVRLEIGDTQLSRKKFEDEEIDDIIAQETTLIPSAARCCEILAARFAGDYDFEADGASYDRSSMTEHYATQGARLRSVARGTTIVSGRRVDGYSDDLDSDDVDNVAV